MHLTRELLHAAAAGRLSAEALLRLLREHLATVCPTCRTELASFRAEVTGDEAYSQVFAALNQRLRERMPLWRGAELAAQRTAEALLALPPAERLGRVCRDPEAFQGVFLAGRMLQAARTALPGDPAAALANAQIAEMAASKVGDHHPELVATALAHQANARRASGHLAEAEPLFVASRQLLADATDTLAIAEIDSLEGSLRMDQRRFEQAESLLSRAALLYQIIEDSTRRARCLITLGYARYHAGDLAGAVEVTRQSLALLDPAAESHLYLCGRHNLTVFLCADGKHLEARDTLAYDADLYQAHPDPWTQLRLAWLQGKISRGLGDLDEAERYLQKARAGFAAREVGYDVALVSLDLALIFAEQGRTRELQALAAEMIAAFQVYELHSEAQAALLLFQRAAAREAITASLIERLIQYLEAARSNPELSFRQG